MAAPRTPRHAWVEQGLRTLAEGGPEAVRIEVLAKALGVTKGGFYGYFADRDALLAEMLEVWERAVTEAVIDEVEAGGGAAHDRLARLRRLVFPGADAGAGPDRGAGADRGSVPDGVRFRTGARSRTSPSS
ncbi:TetR/AcrR family transcriptional regulator [Catenulispora yoronensis]